MGNWRMFCIPHIFSFLFISPYSICVCVCLLQVQRPQNSTLWTLQIKYPQLRDAGIYECQINSEPKMSLSYTMNVIGKYLVLSIGFFACFTTAWITYYHAKMEYFFPFVVKCKRLAFYAHTDHIRDNGNKK